jgi:hypothetical protein
VEINAVLIMQTLFGFELGNYYRSVFFPSSSFLIPAMLEEEERVLDRAGLIR